MSTRILIVDDSVVVRKYLSDLLSAEPDLDAIVAPNGKVALDKIRLQSPRLVILDVEMPVMDGLETLDEIKKLENPPRVIMFSSHTTSGARTTISALTKGAEDYCAKPSDLMADSDERRATDAELLTKIRTLCPKNGAAPIATDTVPSVAAPVGVASSVTGKVDLIAVGSSTGGPNALSELFSRLPADLPVPIVIVQHMPPVFTKHLAERLTSESDVTVHEAKAGDRLAPGEAWIAPGDYHMTLSRRLAAVHVELNQGPPENSCRPSVDVLFRSVNQIYRNRSIGVILTGMGEDGLKGARAMHDSGCRIVVQDQASSVVWGMPGAVSAAGLASAALTPVDLASEMIRTAKAGRA